VHHPSRGSLVPLHIETLSSQIEKASKLDLICMVRCPHKECSAAIFYNLQSKRREVVKFEERKYRSSAIRLVVNF
jgi:hypothetical protein